MRVYDYNKKWRQLLTPEIVTMLSQIHEFKGEQNLFIEAKSDALTQLVEIAKIQSTDASNKIEGIYTSDERLKNSFESLDAYDDVFMDIKPVSFKYNNGTSGRKHFGFGAGQIKESLISHGFTTQDFAGFVQLKDNPDEEGYCGIEDPMASIYTEFTSWNTHMIQKAIKKINEQDTQIKELIQRIEILENR